MHWVVQNNIFSETGWDTLLETLARFNIPYSEHKVIPFVGDLDPDPVIEGPVICIGSYSMRHIAKKKGWFPGVFDLFDQNFLVQKAHWGDRMLNFDSTVLPFKDVHIDEPRFIRPIDDSKYFAGKVFDPDEFHEWQRLVCDVGIDTGISLEPETLVQVCNPKTIYTEVRVWVVSGEIVTASVYKQGSRVIYKSEVDQRYLDYVNELLTNCWYPSDAFVIDVCDTPEGIKIVEINTINSSGFYAGDVQKLVLALEDYSAVGP